MLVELKEILHAECAAVGVVAGVVHLRVAGQPIGFEIDAGVLEDAARIDCARDGLRIARPEKQVEVGDERRGQAGHERVLDEEQRTVRSRRRRRVRPLPERMDQPHAVREPSAVTASECDPEVMVVLVPQLVARIGVGVSDLPEALVRLDEGGCPVDLDVVLCQRAEPVAYAPRIHVRLPREEGDVHVRDAERGAVLAGKRRGKPGDRVLKPDAILEKERHFSGGEGKVELLVSPGPPGHHRGQVAFEEQGVCLEVDLGSAVAGSVALKFAAGELGDVVQRTEESVHPLGRRKPVVDVEVEPGGQGGRACAAVDIAGDRSPPVAIDREGLRNRVLLTHAGA